MLPVIEQLLVLQDRDRKRLRLQEELADIPRTRQRLQEKVAQAAATADQQKQRTRHLESERKRLELEVRTKEDFIRKIETQQGTTKSNEEYKRCTHQIDTTKAEISGLEDQELVLMEKAEVLKADLSKCQEALAATTALVDEELAKIVERQGHVSAQLADFSGVRKTLADRVDPDLLERYDRIFNHRGDAAIVELSGGICRGCNMKVTPACINAARAEKSLVTCPNCSRLVYFTDL